MISPVRMALGPPPEPMITWEPTMGLGTVHLGLAASKWGRRSMILSFGLDGRFEIKCGEEESEFIYIESINRTQTSPSGFVVLKVSFAGGIHGWEAEEDFVLVEEAGLGVDLVDHEYVVGLQIRPDETIKMIAVVSFGAFDVAIVRPHCDGPSLPVLGGTFAY